MGCKKWAFRNCEFAHHEKREFKCTKRVFEFLIKKSDGETALFWAAKNGQCDVAKELIENGAEIDAQNM